MSIVWPGAEPGPWFTRRPRRRRRRPDATRHACRQGRPAAKGCAWVSVSPEVHTGEPARRASLRPVGPASAEATTCFDTLAGMPSAPDPVSYTHLRAHETRHDLVCRLLLETKKK